MAVDSFTNTEKVRFQKYVITGDEALDFFEVAHILSGVGIKLVRAEERVPL